MAWSWPLVPSCKRPSRVARSPWGLDREEAVAFDGQVQVAPGGPRAPWEKSIPLWASTVPST